MEIKKVTHFSKEDILKYGSGTIYVNGKETF